MQLLGAANYDPTTAVSKATSSLLAMTAVDTTNLRLAITVPASGKVLFKLKCTVVGATTNPTILLGAMNGATVLGRQTPLIFTGTQNAATQDALAVAEFMATGLTPGAMNVDAAYAVQVVVASTNIKYGGPNNASGANAWGGFAFEAWDPSPLPTNITSMSIDANGRVDVIKINGTSQTARDIGASVLLAAGQKVDVDTIKTNPVVNAGTVTFPTGATLASTTNITAGTITTATNLTTNNDKTGYGLSAAAVQAIWDALTSALTTVGSIGKLLVDNINATVSSRLASASYTAPDNTSITAIKAKTDSLTYTVAGQVDANIQSVNDVLVNGVGTAGSPWGP